MAQIAVVGCGAIGGLAGLYMARAGERVLFVDRNADHVRAIRERGLSVNGVYGPMAIGPQPACTPDELNESLDGLVFLACKSQATADAVRGIAPRLGASACVVSLQNGLNEDTISAVVGRGRTMGALPDYGGAYLDPGVLEAVHEGIVYVGELDGARTPRAREAARLLGIGPNTCELLTDIVGRLWTKQVYNSQILVSALVDDTIVNVLGRRAAQRLAGAAVREAMQVSDAAGARLQRDAWFDPALYRAATADDTARLLAAYDRLVEHLGGHQRHGGPTGYQYVKRASGIHWDIAYRKRKSEAFYLSVVCVADRYRAQVPLNTRITDALAEVEAGRRTLGWHNIEELTAYTEQIGAALP
jgi:2-dehydropantoate 2-reductase